jgi:hypothetical protein
LKRIERFKGCIDYDCTLTIFFIICFGIVEGEKLEIGVEGGWTMLDMYMQLGNFCILGE